MPLLDRDCQRWSRLIPVKMWVDINGGGWLHIDILSVARGRI